MGWCCGGVIGIGLLFAVIYIVRQSLEEDNHKREQNKKNKDSDFVGLGSDHDTPL